VTALLKPLPIGILPDMAKEILKIIEREKLDKAKVVGILLDME
jgi:hypothetical protein